jgi:hypothetical protein
MSYLRSDDEEGTKATPDQIEDIFGLGHGEP